MRLLQTLFLLLTAACGSAAQTTKAPAPAPEPEAPATASTSDASTAAPALPLLLVDATGDDVEAFAGPQGVLRVVRAEGHLDDAAIRMHLTRLRTPLFGCVESNEVTAGNASVVFTIGADGTTTVEDAHADADGGNEYAARECAKGWVELARGVNAFARGGVTQVEIRLSYASMQNNPQPE